MRLLTLPTPYCTVALDCAIRLKTEQAVPGRSCWQLHLPHCNSSFIQDLTLVSKILGSSKISAPSVGRWDVGVRDFNRLAKVVCFSGTLYQRLVIAEQNLRSELYPYQER